MSWRDFAVHNSRLKLTAVLLALLSWCAIQFAIYKGKAGRDQLLRHRQVMVLKSPDDARAMKVEPPYVDLRLQATRELSADDDIEVYVDITNMPQGVNSVFKKVQVRGEDIEKVVRIDPAWFVRVASISPPDTLSTNAFRKP